MCVTVDEAEIRDTQTYVYATTIESQPVHVCGYQHRIRTGKKNCTLLNFAGTNLQLVSGPERTRSFMNNLTANLPDIVPTPPVKMGRSSASDIRVEPYGNYYAVVSQGPGDIFGALELVPESHRPERTRRLKEKIDFFMSFTPDHTFVLACPDEAVEPKHPIVVSHKPHDPGYFTVPGWDAHNGGLPVPGEPVYRGFRIAFGIGRLPLPHPVRYDDWGVAGSDWAPRSVAGFVDNRPNGPNGDYVVPVAAVEAGLTGRELAATLR